MRAIDGDALKEKAFGKRGGLIHTSDIDAMPTIDPVRKGKWIDGRCNQCGGEAYWKRGREVYGWREFALELTKYCPNCGAEMEEGEQE